MCKYCGNRIKKPHDRWGKHSENGAYCSKDCSDAVYGFDNRIAKERSHVTTSFNANLHDRACTQTRTPAEIMMDEESVEQKETGGDEVMAAMEAARKIDKRLPDILMGIANGETQEQAAKRWGMTRQNVLHLLTKLRTSL